MEYRSQTESDGQRQVVLNALLMLRIGSVLVNTMPNTTLITHNHLPGSKVVKARTYSAQWLYSDTTPIVVVGDKTGRLGFLRADLAQDQARVFTYQPHVLHIADIAICNATPTKLYTCSYDTSLRVMVCD